MQAALHLVAQSPHPLHLAVSIRTLNNENRLNNPNIVPTGQIVLQIGGSNPAGKVAGLSQRMPPQAAEKLKQAVSRLELLKEMADEKNVSVSQLAIAWVLAQGDDILALVGSRTVDQLHDTVKAIDINLSPEDLQRIEQIIPKEYASNSAMLPINLDENGLFKF